MSFTTAAEDLGITQSAVSQQIKSLEHYLDQALFLRRARSLQLTEAGRNYLPTIREAFSVLEQGTAAFFGHDPEKVVEVKANTAFSVFWLAPRLPQFWAEHPGIEVNLSTAMWEADFTGGYGSVEIRFGRGEWGGEVGDLLASVEIFPVATPEVAARIQGFDDLRQEILLHIASTLFDWDFYGEACGVGPLKGRGNHAFNTYVLSLNLARRGLGVAMAHEILAQDLLAAGELVRLFDRAVPTREGYYLLGARHGEMNEAAQAFCTWIKAQIA